MFTTTSWNSSPAPYRSSNRGATWDVHLINYATFSRDAGDRCSSRGKERVFTPTSWYPCPAPYHSSNRGATWDVHLINYATFSRDAWDRCSCPGKGAGVHPDLLVPLSGPISLEQPGGYLGRAFN